MTLRQFVPFLGRDRFGRVVLRELSQMTARRTNFLLERLKQRRNELRRELARVDRAIDSITGARRSTRLPPTRLRIVWPVSSAPQG